MNELTISTWADWQAFLDGCGSTWVFRGQPKSDWRLMPSINRYLDPAAVMAEDAARIEINSILRFRSEAHHYLPTSTLPRDPFDLDTFDNYVEWLALMQHYGAPTRLLDWSFSPYVALYFAVSAMFETDAALFLFDSRPTWSAFCARFGVHPTGTFDYCKLPAALLTAPQGEPFLYTGLKKMRSMREIAQQGLFTFCDHLLSDHQRALEKFSGDLIKVKIPARLKPELLNRLKPMNITPAVLFPGADGICQAIRLDLDCARASNAQTPSPAQATR